VPKRRTKQKAAVAAATRSGALVLVVGPSGAGKDTLIAAARRHFAGNRDIVFPSRVITRAESLGEDHVPVNRRAFASLADAGGFLLWWEANGHAYGIPAAVAEDLERGRMVVVNASRSVVAAAAERWPGLLVIEIAAGVDILRQRLMARGRESEAELEGRLVRAAGVPCPEDVARERVENDGDLASAVRRFIGLLASRCPAG